MPADQFSKLKQSLEIERKFLLRVLPRACANISPIQYERFFLFIGSKSELRVQRKNGAFELERKFKVDKNLSRLTSKLAISSAEFRAFRVMNKGNVLRYKKFVISKSPMIAIKQYSSHLSGLIIGEVEFQTIKEAKAFTPPAWLGIELTNSRYARDRNLTRLKSCNKILKAFA